MTGIRPTRAVPSRRSRALIVGSGAILGVLGPWLAWVGTGQAIIGPPPSVNAIGVVGGMVVVALGVLEAASWDRPERALKLAAAAVTVAYLVIFSPIILLVIQEFLT